MNALSVEQALRLGLLYAHLICCIFAISCVLRADLKIASARFTHQWLSQTARTTAHWLLALWMSGLAIVYIDTGFELEALAGKPKLLLKLACVLVLSMNGLFLHYLAFPILSKSGPMTATHALLLATTGGLSTSHWLMAAFVGIARPLGEMDPVILINAYLTFVVTTIVAAMACAPFVHRQMTNWRLSQSLRELRIAGA